MESPITLQILLCKPTPAVLFGLQKGTGSNHEILQKQMSDGNDLPFTFTITIKGDRLKDTLPKFSGPFVQGPSGGKFVYIGIGTYAGQTNTEWSRRLKVPLTGITWEMIDTLSSKSILQAVVPGTGKDGSPNCATVKPFAGWHLQ